MVFKLKNKKIVGPNLKTKVVYLLKKTVSKYKFVFEFFSCGWSKLLTLKIQDFKIIFEKILCVGKICMKVCMKICFGTQIS